LKTYLNKFLGKITLTDRYIFLTFRRSSPHLRKILQLVSPKPSKIYLMKAKPSTLKVRKGKNSLSPKEIKELYQLFEQIPHLTVLNAEKSLKRNISYVVDSLL